MTRCVTLLRVQLHYSNGMVLHTATSGAVPALDELRLVVRQHGALVALGATRVNIAYLSGLPAETLVAQCCEVAKTLDWTLPWNALRVQFDAHFPTHATACRMLFDMAAADGAAREVGLSLSEHLGGPAPTHLPTNQTLFRCDDDAMLGRANDYVSRGFCDLKLRVGFGPFADDLRRLQMLRTRFGDRIQLSLDANGAWPAAEAAAHLAALAPLQLRYAEQPTPPGDELPSAPIPIMLDESLADLPAVERLAATRTPVLAHLKLAKFGGLDRLMRAGQLLRAADIGFMVGQMNEGAVSTLAAAHAAAALGADMMELYGADGLCDDPAGAVLYGDGCIHLPPGPGLGLMTHRGEGEAIWQSSPLRI
jgi:L-alanine-DL-glutamate epimerase-like enolase superfamily enzyme